MLNKFQLRNKAKQLFKYFDSEKTHKWMFPNVNVIRTLNYMT